MNQKTIRKSDDVISGYKDSTIAKLESNDCSVKALAVVNNWPYERAWSELQTKIGRQFKHGSSSIKLIDYLSECFDPIVTEKPETKGDRWPFMFPRTVLTYKKTGEKKFFKMTVGSFLKLYPTGIYYVVVKGHAFAIVNGEILGEYSDTIKLKRVILCVFKVKN